MGDQGYTTTPPLPAQEEVILVDPDYQSDATNDSKQKSTGFSGPKKQEEKSTKEGGGNEDEKKKKKQEDAGAGNYIRILKYGNGLDWTLQGIGAICAAIAGATFPLMTVVLGEVVSDFTEFFLPNTTMTPAEFRASVNNMCLYFVYLFLAKFILGYIATAFFRLSGTRISAAIRLEYLTSIFRQDLAYFDALAISVVPEASVDLSGIPQEAAPTTTAAAGTPGAVAVSITTLSNTVQMGISEKLGLFIQFVAMLIGGFAVAFAKEWRLTLVTSCILPATLLIYGLSIPIELKFEKRVLEAQGKAAELAEEVLGSIRTVKSFNAEKKLVNRYSTLLEKGRREGVKKAPNSGIQYAGAFTVIYCGYAVCFWYAVRLFRNGDITDAGTVITVFFAVLIAVMSFGSIAPQVQAMAKAASASTTIFQVIDRQPTIDAMSSEGLKPPTMPPGDLELRNVKFSYPGGGERENIVILGPAKDGADEAGSEGISLSFPEGQTTAIVGRSGSGKSTIVGLIERWYDPQQGSVHIGGIDIKDLNLRWWRGQIGLVMQEPFLFNDTIFKNVLYGLMGTEWEFEPEEDQRRRVREACIESNAHAFVEALPEGYDTKVGESGVKLSGGQKQRIAIARSIISKPQILILDEATSAIDPRNERIVQDALDRISKGRTTITIAHRLSTIKKADRIVVLGNGHVLETGTHEELLSRPDGAYTKLVKGQTLLMEDEQAVSQEDLEGDNVVKGEENDAGNGENLVKTTTWRSKLSIGQGKDPNTADDIEAAHPKKPEVLGIIRCISLMLWEQRSLWPLYLFGVLGAIGGGAAFPAQSILLAKFMTVFQYVGDMDEFERQGNFWSLMFLILALAVGASYFLMGTMFTLIQYRLTTHYRLEYFQNVVRQGIPFFDSESNSTGSLTSQLNSDPTSLQNLLGTNTGMITVSFVNVISCSILGLIVGWKLALVCICAALPFIFFAGLVRVRIETKFASDTAAVFAESAQFASEAVGAYRTVSSLIMEESVRARYKLLLGDHVKRSFRATVWAAMVFSASESMSLLGSALCMWYSGRLMSTREYEPYQFFVVYMAIIQSGEAAGQFFGFTPDIAQAMQAANRILAMREKNPPPPGQDMDRSESGGYEVEFRNVNFSYPTRDAPVFRDLSLKIEKGQFAAFVGASGCGKTTTISLLERFYSVTGGEILVDGKNLESIEIESYRDVVSLVAQEPSLYQGTVSENVRLGAKDENVSYEAVVQACREAHIHDFISSLPDGYETICGSRGVGLSGGQKQRIAIARALIRKPKILLLDEATASLDSESEKIVQKAFEDAAQGRTMIAVAHRLSTIQKADVIFVFDEGKVVEKGSHSALIKKRGTYFQMCQAQALDH